MQHLLIMIDLISYFRNKGDIVTFKTITFQSIDLFHQSFQTMSSDGISDFFRNGKTHPGGFIFGFFIIDYNIFVRNALSSFIKMNKVPVLFQTVKLYADNLFLPLLLRALMTFLPEDVFILFLNPCSTFLCLFFG